MKTLLGQILSGHKLGFPVSKGRRTGQIKGEEMKPDYDLSDLETSQAELWLSLRVDAICVEILADQAKLLASIQSGQQQPWPRYWQGYGQDCLWLSPSSLPGRIDLGSFDHLPSRAIRPPASPASSALPPIQVVSPWIH